MVRFGGEIGTLYQIFTPCTPLPKYKREWSTLRDALPGPKAAQPPQGRCKAYQLQEEEG